ncbi:MAG: hypothetical protein JWO43_594 [Candidatus Adlerbacteria bacterium]|nr:hypothetical protein [Candidatus Adlerbacteria bacterium]
MYIEEALFFGSILSLIAYLGYCKLKPQKKELEHDNIFGY